MSHSYPAHIAARHRADRLRPDLTAAPAVRSDPATVPVQHMLPLARPASPTDLRFDVKSVDPRGRVALTEARRSLGWEPTTRLALARGDGFLAVTATDDADGPTLLSQARLQLPVWAQQLLGLRPGTQVLMVVDPAGEVRLHPSGAVADALHAVHTAEASKGEPT